MKKKISLLFFVLLFSLLFSGLSFAQVSEYLCEIGKLYYSRGQYGEALHEFNKALLVDPNNILAKSYCQTITKKLAKSAWTDTLDKLEAGQKPGPQDIRGQIVASALDKFLGEKDTEKKESEAVKFSGVYQIALGGTSDGLEWKRANGNLNERDYHILSSAALNNRENTFDPRIYDRLRLDVDTQNQEGLNVHTNITIDPWSFTGKSDKFTLTSINGTDTAELELKYWSNTRRTLNETIFTPGNGDSFALPEIKVEDEKTAAGSVNTVFGGTFNIPSVKISREFQPVRELWFDYKTENSKFRFFPIALGNQALTSDDPLGLSNHHIYWEESPWTLRWKPGALNTNPNDFTQGKWDDSLAFVTRDSDLTRLTALRGFAFDWQPAEETSLKITGASPKGLWQDYDSFDNFPAAARFKQTIGDMLQLGSTYTFRLGLNEDKDNKKDALNHVWGMDFGVSPFSGTKLQGEIAASRSKQDLSSAYASQKRGFAYQVSLLGASKGDITESAYNEIRPEDSDSSFLKTRLQFTHMDKGFEPALASYRESRDDQFWSRHIHFRKPYEHYWSDADLNQPSLSWDDIAPFAIGDGIDIGRDVIGFRIETSSFNRKLDELFDVRNVHRTNGKYLENIARSETTFKAGPKLTTKLLAIYHNVHQTYGKKDPFLVDAQTDRVFDNSIIPDSKSPSMKTFSLGANYDFFDWASLYGIWEYSNDINAAYDGFPRGVLNSSNFETFSGFGRTFRNQTAFVYNQYYFPLPPYPFNNAYKLGLTLGPWRKWEVFLDFTRNEYEYAGQISDDINHAGIEIGYQPIKKLKFFAKYVYSQVQDLVMMNNSEDVRFENHHNLFLESRYSFSDDDELTFQFGEFGRGPIAAITFDPFGGSLDVLDTQYIYRVYYRRKF